MRRKRELQSIDDFAKGREKLQEARKKALEMSRLALQASQVQPQSDNIVGNELSDSAAWDTEAYQNMRKAAEEEHAYLTHAEIRARTARGESTEIFMNRNWTF